MYLKSWRYYLQFYSGMKGKFFLTLGLSIFQAFFLLPVALLIRYSFDKVIPQGELHKLFLVSLIVLGLYLLSNAIALWTRKHILQINKLAIQRYRDELLKKVFSFSRSFYSQADRNKIHNSIVQDSERLDQMSNNLVILFLPSFFISIFLVAILLFLDWFLFLVLLGILPIIYFVGRLIGRKAKHHIKDFHHNFEKFNKGIAFILKTLDLAQVQTAEDLEMKKQLRKHQALRIASGKMVWFNTAYRYIQNMIVVCSGIIILLVGGREVIRGQMSLGDLLAFFYAFGLLRDHLRNIHNASPILIEGTQSLVTLYEIINIQEPLPYQGKEKIPFYGNIEIKNVSFKYSQETVLKNVRLSIIKGQTIALVGPSGAGKSTIINLILGFYRPTKGEISAEGRPYEVVDLKEIRRKVGVVMQDPMLFPGTIHENITYGLAQVEEGKMSDALEASQANEFIKDFPDGLDTPIGENGVLISGGQGQRLALTRALIRKPSLLILDEPTNHLDPITIGKFLQSLKAEKKDMTILIISHDERVIQDADYIYMIQNGEITEAGSPQQLKTKKAYGELFQLRTSRA